MQVFLLNVRIPTFLCRAACFLHRVKGIYMLKSHFPSAEMALFVKIVSSNDQVGGFCKATGLNVRTLVSAMQVFSLNLRNTTVLCRFPRLTCAIPQFYADFHA